MARFKCRAPNFWSVPSSSRKSRARSVHLKTNCLPAVAIMIRSCTRVSSISRICSRFSRCKVRNTITLSMRFMNSGENFLRAASIAVR